MTTDTITVHGVDAGTRTSGRSEDVWGARRVGLYNVTFSSSFPGTAGGATFDPRKYGFDRPVGAVFISQPLNAVSTGRYQFTYDKVNAKIQVWDTTDDDVADGDDLSTVSVDVLVISE
jgi:hypothetical protein